MSSTRMCRTFLLAFCMVLAMDNAVYPAANYQRAFADAFKRLKGAARSQGASQRWLAPGPNPDNWAAMEDNIDKGMLMLVVTRD